MDIPPTTLSWFPIETHTYIALANSHLLNFIGLPVTGVVQMFLGSKLELKDSLRVFVAHKSSAAQLHKGNPEPKKYKPVPRNPTMVSAFFLLSL